MAQPIHFSEGDQKSFLTQAKLAIEAGKKRKTWDEFAHLLAVEPRAMKTYRMPKASADYRTMPKLLVEKIETLIAQAGDMSEADASDSDETPTAGVAWHLRPDPLKLLPKSLSALVTRQARRVLIGGGASMVSGVDLTLGGTAGLTDEDRRAMALVSRVRLKMGLSDIGAEIHDLLAQCTAPLGDWLPIPEITEAGLAAVRLIDPDDRMPTLEADELSAKFSGMTSLFEEQLFATFKDALSKHSESDANEYYTAVRTFVGRNPIVKRWQLLKLVSELPSAVWACVEQQFYEPMPNAASDALTLTLCSHCSNLMIRREDQLQCTTKACAAVHGVSPGQKVQAADMLRLNRALRKYWHEPGIDELRMADQLTSAGHPVRLYPDRDIVDIDLGVGSDYGIDLKAYSSPELLGDRINRRPGGLTRYKIPMLVIPDWLTRKVPNYIERVNARLDSHSIRAMTISTALEEIGRA